MGLFGRLVNRFGKVAANSRASTLEARGQLEEAYELYQAAGQGADAARVMLARADRETDPTQRLALLSLAASSAPDNSPIAGQIRKRRALLALDLARCSPGSLLPSELSRLARDLEEAELLREAAEVCALLGDVENQSRLLAACGAIADLEAALQRDQKQREATRKRQDAWTTARDLDSLGRRLDALRHCDAWLAESPQDEEFVAFARSTRARLLREPTFAAAIGAQRYQVVLGCPVTVGRADCSVVLPSPVLSRRHIEIRPGPHGATVADLGSRNGTTIAGARLDAAVPVGSGVELRLGDQIPCRVQPRAEGGVVLELAGAAYLSPLGPLRIGPFEVTGEPEVVRLRAVDPSHPPVLNGLRGHHDIELARGDEVREGLGGPVLLKVLET